MGKPCSNCNVNPRWSSGLCLTCDKISHPEKYLIKKKGVSTLKATPITPKKRSFIKPISDKQASKLAEYRVVRDAFLKAHPVCGVAGCVSKEVELHHKKSRSSHLSDITVFMSVCRTHHRKIHDNHQWAVENSYIQSSTSLPK